MLSKYFVESRMWSTLSSYAGYRTLFSKACNFTPHSQICRRISWITMTVIFFLIYNFEDLILKVNICWRICLCMVYFQSISIFNMKEKKNKSSKKTAFKELFLALMYPYVLLSHALRFVNCLFWLDFLDLKLHRFLPMISDSFLLYLDVFVMPISTLVINIILIHPSNTIMILRTFLLFTMERVFYMAWKRCMSFSMFFS